MKQKETLEEAAERLIKINLITSFEKSSFRLGVFEGAKWQSEQMYSEEEVLELIMKFEYYPTMYRGNSELEVEQWFEKYKK